MPGSSGKILRGFTNIFPLTLHVFKARFLSSDSLFFLLIPFPFFTNPADLRPTQATPEFPLALPKIRDVERCVS